MEVKRDEDRWQMMDMCATTWRCIVNEHVLESGLEKFRREGVEFDIDKAYLMMKWNRDEAIGKGVDKKTRVMRMNTYMEAKDAVGCADNEEAHAETINWDDW